MPTSFFSTEGRRVGEIELLDIFPANEGQIAQIYGRIGSGKTYIATAMILDFLRKGHIVYANYRVKFDGYDERNSKFHVFCSLIFFWIKRFYVFPKANLKYFEFSDTWAQKEGYADWTDWLASRTDCDIFADEGHVMFDSYVGIRMSLEKRAAIYHTRHYNRTIYVISQRPTSIHVSMRSQVNTFYRCEKRWQFFNLIRFRRTEFQDMKDENVDEDEEKALNIVQYWGRKRIFNAYESKYLRGDTKQSQKVMFEAYDYGYLARIILLFRNIFGSRKLKKRVLYPIKEEAPSRLLT